MSSIYRVAVIGCGRPRTEGGATGFGMSHAHVHGYLATGRCRLAAVADISRENAEDFVGRYGGAADVYLDYHEMLATAKPDIVSVCTWPHLHEPMALAAIGAGVRAVHCEKPMAPTWGAALRMHQAAVAAGVQLTFNHQRRFLEPFQTARRLIRQGAIGTIQRIEGSCGDMIDWGTHWLDMFFFYNGETPAEWVIGQIDHRQERRIFGVPVESQGLCQIKFANGVRGLLFTGHDADIGCANRIIGSEGALEVHNARPHLRLQNTHTRGWVDYPTQEGLHGGIAIDRGIADLIRCLDEGSEPELSSHKAVRCTEVIFATYESSRRRGRVDIPLEAEDSAFLSLLEKGAWAGSDNT